MMGFVVFYFFFLFAVLIPNCIALPFTSVVVTYLSHGRRSPRFTYNSYSDDVGDISDIRKRIRDPSTPPGYSPDGRCGPQHEGLMCNPNSTIYVVSNLIFSLLNSYI